MNAIQKLEAAVEHGESFDDFATKIHDAFEAGAKEMSAIYDDVQSFVDAGLAHARTAASSFKDGFTKVQSKFEGTDDALKSDTTATDAPPNPPAPTTPTVTTPAPSVMIAVVPAAATEAATVTTPIGDVTVQPGTTVHVDSATMPDDAAVTTVPHDGSAATATTVSGVEVAPDPTVVALAKVATADAGVKAAA